MGTGPARASRGAIAVDNLAALAVAGLAALAVVASPRAAEAAPRRALESPRGAVASALRTGRYEDVLRLAAAVERPARGDRVDLLACRARIALGRTEEARRALEATLSTAPNDLAARDVLMRLLALVGDRAALEPLLARTYADWNEGRVDGKRAADLVAVATAARLDGNWKDANETLRDAVRADRRATAANLDWGEMFLEKHAADEAEASFRAVLAVDEHEPDAYVGLARAVLDRRYDAALARGEIERALAVNPRHAGALALRAELALDRGDAAGVAADVARLRETNPADPGAARVAAAAALLADDAAAFARERDRHLAAQAGDAGFYAFVADALVRQRRYDEARAVEEEGVRLDPACARCVSGLATILLRLGDEDRGLETLRRAWQLDPYDARTFNLLDLYEKVIPARYETFSTAHLRFRIEPATRPAIEEVVAPFLEETYARYVARYGFAPKGPIVFELYGDPRHFAVRTVGLPSIDVSGVCFGRVITSQAPTNHAFNWGMVLAHELAHVFALELSRARVPRWFTEGLAEVETTHLRPEWARREDVALWGAMRRNELPPLVSLSDAFLDMRVPHDPVRDYAHAALAVDFLERRFGFGRIREALVAFGRGTGAPAVLGALAGMPGDALERAFRDDLSARLGRYDRQYVPTELTYPFAAADPGPPTEPVLRVANGLSYAKSGRQADARDELAHARGASPQGAVEQAAEDFLAGELALARRDADGALAAFTGVLALAPGRFDGYDVRVRLALAELHHGDRAAAEAHLRRAIAFDDSRVEPHALLAELYRDEGRDDDRAAELEAALRLEPQSAARAKELVLASARAGRSARVLWAAGVATFIDPGDADVLAAEGRALVATGQPAAAAKVFERALRCGPADPAALHRALADLYVQLGDRRRADAHRAAGAP